MNFFGCFLMALGVLFFAFIGLNYSAGDPVTAEIIIRPILASSYIIAGAILTVGK